MVWGRPTVMLKREAQTTIGSERTLTLRSRQTLQDRT